MARPKMTSEQLQKHLHELFDLITETVGIDEMQSRLQKVDRLEDRLNQAIDEATVDRPEPGIVLVSLMNVLAEHVVAMCIKEPPEVPAPVLSLEAVKNGLKMVNEAMSHFASSAIRSAESNGCTIAMRFRPKRRTDEDEATDDAEDTPSDAPEAAGPLRDAAGATEGGGESPPPAYDRDRDNPLTDETTFGARPSGTEG